VEQCRDPVEIVSILSLSRGSKTGFLYNGLAKLLTSGPFPAEKSDDLGGMVGIVVAASAQEQGVWKGARTSTGTYGEDDS
jgi:hypothetical protein